MIRLLVVDDSALMRRLIGRLFAAEGDFDLYFARDGVEAIALLADVRPHVVTLDVEMPRMDGLACLDRIMLEHPCPVVMLSALTEAGADATLRALEAGAFDAVPKPGGAPSLAMDELGPRLVGTVRAAAAVKPRATLRLAERVRLRAAGAAPAEPRRRPPPPRPAAAARPEGRPAEGLVLIGTSTGGPTALDAVLPRLPADLPYAVVVAQHMPAAFTATLAARLDALCALDVVEAWRPMPLEAGRAYIGRGDADVLVAARPSGPTVLPAPRSPSHRWHPSVERLVDSALLCWPADRLIGVMLTGMGDDGAAAMARLHAAGGRTVAESEETAVVWGMPGALVRAGGAGRIAPLDAVAAHILECLP